MLVHYHVQMKLMQNNCLMTPHYQYHYRIYSPHRLENFVVGVFRSISTYKNIFQRFPINFETFDTSKKDLKTRYQKD